MARTLVIPFFVPHGGCPFTCVFCNQWEISGTQEEARPEDIYPRVKAYLETSRESPEKIEIAFYGGSFTGLSPQTRLPLLAEAARVRKLGLVTGIRLSTRPDYISEVIMDELTAYGVTTLELGVQSLVDEVLEKSCRGHSWKDTVRATDIIRKYPMELGYQLMLGLPGDSMEYAYETASRAISLKPDFVRIYPTLVMKNTILASWFQEGRFIPWSLDQAVEVAAKWLATFTYHQIPVIRMGLQATENLSLEGDLLAGPYHPAFGHLVNSYLMLEQLKVLLADMTQNKEKLIIYGNEHDISQIIGQKKANIRYMEKLLCMDNIEVIPHAILKKGDLLAQKGSWIKSLSRKELLDKYRIQVM